MNWLKYCKKRSEKSCLREEEQTTNSSSIKKNHVYLPKEYGRNEAQRLKEQIFLFYSEFRINLVEGSSKRAGEELEQESTKKQKVDEDKDTAELQSLMEVIPDEEEVAIDVVPLATKSPTIVDWKIHKEGKNSYYQIDLKTMFDPHVEDTVWKNQQNYKVLDWKLYDSCGVHSLRMQHVHIHMLVEKKYPLIPSTITDMLNKKLQGRIVGIKILFNTASITAAHIKVNAAEGVNAVSEEVSTAETMNLIATQQVALDNALIAPEKRVQIGQCNMRIDPIKTLKEPTYQVFWHTITKIKNSSSYKFKLDKKQCQIDVEVFRDILQICPRLPNQEFDAPPLDEEIVTFIKELEHKGDIKSVTDVEDFVFQIDNKDHKKQEKMYYPRFTKVIIHHFISKDKSISMRNRIFMHIVRDDSVLGTLRFVSKFDEYQVYGALLPEGMTNQQMRDSPAYKTYLAFSTGATTPKKARKFKKHASPSKKKTFKKAPAKTKRSKGIELLSNVALLEEAQLKKAIKQSRRETNINQASGSSEGANLESDVLDKPKGKSIDTRDSDDDNDDDDQQSNDERTESDDDNKVFDINKTNDEEDDEFVHTPEDYVPINDEDVDDEEFDHINKEMYSDVNVELKDSKCEGEGKDDEEMTDPSHEDIEHENVSQEVAGDQDKDDTQATATVALAT
ncbi:hypothetical protein Tco_0588956 [Tanacetum coccineum]